MNSKRFGIVVDIGHLWDPASDPDGENPFTKKDGAYAELAKCGPFLRHVHLHDVRKDGDHHLPFMGDIRWGELFCALKKVEYGGTFMFEPGGLWGEKRRSDRNREVLGHPVEDTAEILALIASFPDRLSQECPSIL